MKIELEIDWNKSTPEIKADLRAVIGSANAILQMIYQWEEEAAKAQEKQPAEPPRPSTPQDHE